MFVVSVKIIGDYSVGASINDTSLNYFEHKFREPHMAIRSQSEDSQKTVLY